MVTWKKWEGDGNSWDALLKSFPDHTFYQRYGWGEHKGHYGWLPYRLVAENGGGIVAMVQVLVRQFRFSTALAWASGGPVGEISGWDKQLFEQVRKIVGARNLYLRVNPMRMSSESDKALMSEMKWRPCTGPILSGKSVFLNFEEDQSRWLASIQSKHRYYVKKSLKADIDWHYGDSDSLLVDLDRLITRLSEDKAMNLKERDVVALRDLKSCMPGGLRFLIGYMEGEPVSGCMVLVDGIKAVYATAATIGKGREVSAAYAMFYKLRENLRQEEITDFNFGGINPDSVHGRGVDHFKLGFAGREGQYLGEWDYATSFLLRHAANHLIKRKAGVM